jgi:excisionase family DNA binding protein
VVLGLALRGYQRRGGFDRMPADQRRLVDTAIAELEQAGKLWRERSGVFTSGHECSEPVLLTAVAHTGDVLLTTADAAEILGISVSGVRRLMGRGDLPAVKVGGSVRFRRVDLETFMETRRTA